MLLGRPHPAAADGTPALRHAFATSVTGSGDLSTWADVSGLSLTGVAAGDAICQARATAASLTGTYVAWLSTGSNDAYCHVQGLTGTQVDGCSGAVTLPGAGPWVRTDGTPWSGTLDEIVTANVLFTPLVTDESGTIDISNAQARWTGTHPDGTPTGGDCDGWTNSAAVGLADAGRGPTTADSWTLDQSALCNATNLRLICLETGPGLPPAKPRDPGALVFVSSIDGDGDLSTWPGAGGLTEIAAGDSVCQSLASTAGLPDPQTFVAWLSDGRGINATDRITTDGPWKRVDGIPIANSKADLLDAALFTSISQDETGAYPGKAGVWTASDPSGIAGIYHCNEWRNSSNAGTGLTGALNSVRASWTDGNDNSCDMINRIYCFSNVVSVFFDNFEGGDTSRWDVTVSQ